MQKCSYCGADLPENTRFCGKCGNVQDTISTDAAVTGSNTPQLQSWMPEDGTMTATWLSHSNDPTQGSAPDWSPNVQAPETPPPPPAAENEDERRTDIPPWSPLYDAALGENALLGSGQISTPGVPVVQGTPQVGSVPGVAGSPTPYTNAPASPPVQGAASAPGSPPTQGPGNAPVTHPVQGPGNAPISRPVQRPVKVPHPQPKPHPIHHPGPRPIHHPHPPEQPGGTQEDPPTHKHHRHHDHPDEHEHHQQHTHPARHAPHRAARVTKLAGGSTVKTIVLVVVAVAVVAAGGIAAAVHFLAHPQPLISITSNYKVGNAPAGANGTILHISGQQFSSNSAITFLLDGTVAPGNPGTRSDSNGSFSTDMTITSAWSAGTHTLTARDASNDSTHNGISVTIVQPGQANTPGPDGAPPDDASFRLNVTIQVADPYVGEPFASNPVLIITGHPDPEGGAVCSPDDSGQSFTYSGTTYNHGTSFTETETATCSGTYKAGQISYIETDTSARGSLQSNGVTANCVLNNPAVILQLTGAYVANGTFSGTINYPYVSFICDQQGSGFYQEALNGTWTGTIVKQ